MALEIEVPHLQSDSRFRSAYESRKASTNLGGETFRRSKESAVVEVVIWRCLEGSGPWNRAPPKWTHHWSPSSVNLRRLATVSQSLETSSYTQNRPGKNQRGYFFLMVFILGQAGDGALFGWSDPQCGLIQLVRASCQNKLPRGSIYKAIVSTQTTSTLISKQVALARDAIIQRFWQ